MTNLPQIPVIQDAETPMALFSQDPARAKILGEAVCRVIPGFIVRYLAGKSEQWLNRVKPPYKEDVDRIADAMGKESYFLNLLYEWGCTTTARDDSESGGVTMYRALDWPLPGMGDKLVVAKHTGPAGEYWNIAYPGFMGVLNAMAEGRFTIAINSAPIPRHGWGQIIDRIITKRDNLKNDHIPAAFLLRKVFEECADYRQAVEVLSSTPVCSPAIFTVAGINEGEHCVIERLPEQAIVREGLTEKFVCTTNHWNNGQWKAHDGFTQTRLRHKELLAGLPGYQGDFDWLKGAVLNWRTKLAFEANARTGTMKLVGVEGSRFVTQILTIQP